MDPTSSINQALFPATARTAAAAKPSDIECEVIDLFERFRNPLLWYALSFGLSGHDSEEVMQEVFLSLFRHLQYAFLPRGREQACQDLL